MYLFEYLLFYEGAMYLEMLFRRAHRMDKRFCANETPFRPTCASYCMKKRQQVLVLVVVCLGILLGSIGCRRSQNETTPTTPDNQSFEALNPNEEKQIVLSDSLTDGTTKATAISGGEFTPEGYHFTSHEGYLIYDTEIRGNFRVEFDTKGLSPDEWYHDPDDQSTLLIMQDVPLGTDWVQWEDIPNCLFQLYKLTKYPGGELSENGLKVKGGCNGGAIWFETTSYTGGTFVGPHPLEWDPSKAYHWQVTVKDGNVEIFRDDALLMFGYGFYPGDPMRFMFGGTGQIIGRLTPDDATYSNIRIYQE